jgi:isochorismate synthase
MSDTFETFEFEDGAWFETPGLRITTRGSRRTLLVPPGADQLSRVADAARGALEAGELAIGAIGFTRTAQVLLTIPAETTIEHDPAPLPAPEPRPVRPLRIEAFPSPDRYEASVADALARIDAGALDKVVLARMLIAHAAEPFDRHRLLALLAHREPDATRFAVQGFIGASPELLIAKHGNEIVSHPLAGTRPLARGAELLEDPKERAEHAIVADAVAGALEPFVTSLTREGPSIVETSTLAHLGTRISGRLRDRSTSVLDLVAALHPTPAIAGMPLAGALDAIAGLEGFDRSLYAGAVGWIDADGDGRWALTLRCAEVRGRIAMLFAGAGIVAGSDPVRERIETDAKFEPMRSALERC